MLPLAVVCCAEGPLQLPGAASRLVEPWTDAMAAVQRHPTHRAPVKTEAVARVRSERKLQAIQKEIKYRLTGKTLQLLPEYDLKLSILKKLEFVSETEVFTHHSPHPSALVVASSQTPPTCWCSNLCDTVASEYRLIVVANWHGKNRERCMNCKISLRNLVLVCVKVVKMKGRVACEISTCECLIATEAIFRGLFTDLTPAEALSLLCCLVNQNKVAEASFGRVPDALKAAVQDLTAVVRSLGELQRDEGLTDIDPAEYTTTNVRPCLLYTSPSPRD